MAAHPSAAAYVAGMVSRLGAVGEVRMEDNAAPGDELATA
jgi:hypothetical protein